MSGTTTCQACGNEIPVADRGHGRRFCTACSPSAAAAARTCPHGLLGPCVACYLVDLQKRRSRNHGGRNPSGATRGYSRRLKLAAKGERDRLVRELGMLAASTSTTSSAPRSRWRYAKTIGCRSGTFAASFGGRCTPSGASANPPSGTGVTLAGMTSKIITATITLDADTGDSEVDERILDIAEQEGLKFAAMLTDRLEAEGIDDIQVRVK